MTNLQIRNKYLFFKDIFIQITKIAKKNKLTAILLYNNDENKIILSERNINYIIVMMQEHNNIIKLQEKNQSLRIQLKEIEITLAQNNDIKFLLKSENNMSIINFLQMHLLYLDRNKNTSQLLTNINYLERKINNYQSCTRIIEKNLQILLHQNEILKRDINIVKQSNYQLLYVQDEQDKTNQYLKNALHMLSGKIYEKFTCLQMEVKKIEAKEVYLSKKYKMIATPEYKTEQQLRNICAYKICVYMYRMIHVRSDSLQLLNLSFTICHIKNFSEDSIHTT